MDLNTNLEQLHSLCLPDLLVQMYTKWKENPSECQSYKFRLNTKDMGMLANCNQMTFLFEYLTF
jgi:hypothetical protein